jgi:sugar phosphate isomerase/epimerase
MEEALADYRTAAVVAAEEADRFGMGVALEPLNRTEANLLHTVEEATHQAELIRRPNVGVLADSYHMVMEAEPFHHLLGVQGLRHVQVCDTGRVPPGSGNLDLAGFFIFLNRAGYDRTIAVESAFSDFATEAPRALAAVKAASALTGELSFAA